MRLFADLLKDATASSVHASTALGNVAAEEEAERKRNQTRAAEAGDTRSDGEVLKCSVAKVDGELGLVFGFAIICKQGGEDYYDLQGDHIPERSMLGAATDFMLHSRVSKEMHVGGQDGTVVFAFPLTTEIAKALDITTKRTGFLIAMKPSPDVLGKYRSGEYTGFSIGGCYGSVVEVD